MIGWKRVSRFVVVALGLAAAVALPQNPLFKKGNLPQSKLSLQRENVNPQKIDVLRRPKVAFKPFPLRDPRSLRPISRDAYIDLPAMGDLPTERAKRVKAGVFFDELNKLEKGFNDLGYSLNSPEEEVLIQKTKIDRTALMRTAALARSQHLKFDRTKMFDPPTINDFARKRLGQIVLRPDLVLRDAEPRYDKSFQYSAGDPDIATAFVRGSLKTEGSRTLATVNGEFAVGATLFKKSADVLRMAGSMSTPGTGNMSGRVDLFFLGFVIHSYTKNTSAPFTYNSDFSKEFRQQIVPISFFLGPVPMTGEVGIVGRAGVKYGISLAPLNAQGLLAPYAHIGVYAEIGTGIPIVSLGVGAELILVEDRVEFVGGASVKDVATAQPYLLLSVSGTNVLEMLAGRLYFWVKIPVPTWKPPFWKKKKYDWDVFNWEGFKVQGVLFNNSKRVDL